MTCAPITGRISVAELGISQRELTDFMSTDHATPEAFLTERIAMAERVVTSDVLGRYSNRIIVNTFLDNARIGDYGDTQEVQSAAANTDNGFVLETCAPQANLKIEISRIEVYTDIAGDVDVRFYDLQDGALLHTETITAVADEVASEEVSIVIVARRRNMRILVVTDLASFYRSTPSTDIAGCTRCNPSLFSKGIVKAYGALIDNTGSYKYSNIERSAYTSGLSVIASVVCDHAAWLCEIKGQLSLPMGLQTAKQVVVYGVDNVDRLNNRNFSEERLKQLVQKANRLQGEYVDAMDKLFKNMPLPTDEVCFDCARSSRQTISIP